MPGGPTQPDLSALVSAIKDQSVIRVDDGRLRVARGIDDESRDRWLAVIDTADGAAWAIIHTLGVILDKDTFAALARCRVDGNKIAVDGGLFVLVPPSPLADVQLAILAPAAP